MQTGNKTLMREMNNRLVLETIIKYQPISRASLAQKLGLTKSTISAIVAELIGHQLIIEIGSDETRQGRKPILLCFHRKAGYSVSLLIDNNNITALLTDMLGEHYALQKISFNQRAENMETRILDTIKALKDYAPSCFYELIGISLLVYDCVFKDILIDPITSRYQYLVLKEKLELQFQVPVFLNNEAELSALAEHITCHRDDNICALNIHNRINLGIIINKNLYQGANGMAGKLKHLNQFAYSDLPYRETSKLFDFLTESSLVQELRRKKHNADLNMQSLIDGYHHNDAIAYTVIKRFTYSITWCIQNILVMYNPSVIVISNPLINACPDILNEIKLMLPPLYANDVQLTISTLSPSSNLLGGIYRVLMNFLGISSLYIEKELPYVK